MNDVYYYLINYKEIHPLRFWIILVGITLLFIAIIFILYKNFLPLITKILNIQKKETIVTSKKNRKTPNVKKEKRSILKDSRFLISVILIQFLIIASVIFYNYAKSTTKRPENLAISNSEYLFGIDISHYQSKINWSELRTSHHPIEYIFIRATMGQNGEDIQFDRNWENAKKHNYLRGAYHYYRPNENSTQQFENFKSVVKLEEGDFIPILDIEKDSKFGRDNLRKGVLNWLQLAEKEYGRKPMIYTGLTFYKHVLKGHVDDYPLWIAAYSGKHRLKNVDWKFHQFTEQTKIKGIITTVDGNDFIGDITELNKMKISNSTPTTN
ncbi:glycoside hydrolase family 25 protein [Winogradskyella undariae]|uniref:GH25 family lysozyme n=1 Tax=Winogradskyella TaxID=286104 RepID=UPI00156B05C5|nr:MULTISPECIES: GH25 family lysozyme [Winogradskyella]NRR91215.1 glycoside hydrolase family 25 protein [Winogradskyella undariae]QXP80402.1 glycoside hydrolase family 25 protein [Winogradskyella sp. HaHa_3_26]